MHVRWLVVIAIAGCGVRTPKPIDVTALLSARGPIEARRDLAIRVIEDPRDVQAHLALAELDDKLGRPSDSIDQLEAVVALGGPIGIRWHAEDRARLGRLVLARGRVRLARGSARALPDFERAARFGVTATPEEVVDAKVAVAVARLRHIDAAERAKGRALLVALSGAHTKTYDLERLAREAGVAASPVEHGNFGVWLWQLGARREAYEQLAAWHAQTHAPRELVLQSAYLRALAWWSPIWLGAAPPPAEDLVGPERCWFPSAGCTPPTVVETAPIAVAATGRARETAMIRYARARVESAADETKLRPIAEAFARDPAVAERMGRDLVASTTDAATGHASIGALFDALGDPARARIEWQAAVDSAPEPAFVRGLALAAARAGDPDAALIFATAAAAASGDPAVVWLGVARTLEGLARHVDALVAAHNAIDLAGPEVVPRALEVAIAASVALGRTAQVDAFLVQRARVPNDSASDAAAAVAAYRKLPTAGTIARVWVASRNSPRDVASRVALVTALDRDDPRHAAVTGELVALAGDPDDAIALAAVDALRAP